MEDIVKKHVDGRRKLALAVNFMTFNAKSDNRRAVARRRSKRQCATSELRPPNRLH